ncbi:long-chain fatty acid--CoA ligase [Halobacillus shinanisalinarum]|uniref:Long-chain fatty acid--CoA ligase n=1 Tax=Halobacillus shinanisalinarum TaxID=2932258 RepID=A0ABY4H2B9_9BACI|nr:long-chain fatty acid--CoA ligase [Halobacillus shinanisalinarum]UOQ94603.1 long-chain fatty acid--CoA ligase [Halobacillus shinanisalinarum]
MQGLTSRPWHKYHHGQRFQSEFPETSLYSILTESTKKYGEHTAITFAGEAMTYHELKSRTDQLAGSWQKMNFKKGERIGLMVGNHPDYIVSYYAAQSLGLIVVQLNPSYTTRELLQILTDADVSYIVADATSLQTVCEVDKLYSFKEMIASQVDISECRDRFWQLEELVHSDTVLDSPASVDMEDVAVIQYTGGTTGKVKGAMLTQRNLTTNVYQSFTMYRQRAVLGGETILTATPLYHVYAMTSAMNLGIYMGANILLVAKFNVDDVMDLIKEYQPTFFPGVPKMYISFANYPNAETYGLDCFNVCSSGSAPLPIEVIKKFEAVSGAKILEGFGMSETSPTTHRTPINGERKVGSIGIPVPDTDCCIVDQDQNVLEANFVGELVIKGPQVMKGYWNNEVETSHALQSGWLFTGDLAMMDDDGYFYIVGRKKEMIINGGFNIYPQEIESVLYEHPDVKESAVVGIPDREKGEVVKAYIVPKAGHTIDIEELKGHCYRNLTRYKVPKRYEIMDELPRNTVGKLLKRTLVEEEKRKLEEELNNGN